jgi:ABC-type Mn2+/Zn2+ transport system permease subunit
VFLGFWISYSFDIPSGAAIVSVSIIILVIVALVKKARIASVKKRGAADPGTDLR